MSRFGLLVLASFLAVDPWGWDRFGPFRWALLSTIGFAAIAISLGSGDARLRPLPRWAVLGWVITLVGLTVSSLLSPDMWHALIGTPDRHFGLATWVMFAGVFATASLYPNSALLDVFRATAVASALTGVWAVLEWRNISVFDSSFAGDRVGGPFGQPAFLGAAMVLAAPVNGALALDDAASRAWRFVGAVATMLAFFTLILSESRAAWVGFVVAGACLILRRRMWLAGALATVALAALLFGTSVGDRASTLTEFDSGVVQGRVDEWTVGARALADTSTYSVFGYGPEGYRTVFGARVDEDYVIRHGREVITDRAHNGLLDTGLAGGVIAGLGMLLLQTGLVVTAVQRLRADDPADVGLAAAVLGYLVQQFFLFPLAEVDAVLWVFAGLLVARRPHRNEARAPLFRSVSAARQVAMLGAGLIAAVSGVAGLSDIAADHAIGEAVDAPDDEEALAAADTARSRRPDSIRYDFIAARTASREGTLDGYRRALVRLDDGLGISPDDPALLEERGVILLEVARRSTDDADLEEALRALDELDDADPNNPTTELTHGIALALAGRNDEAIDELEHAGRLDPSAVEPWLNLALIHFDAGDMERGALALDAADRAAPENAQAQALRREFLSE